MFDTLVKSKLIIVISNTEQLIIFTNIWIKLMLDNNKDYELCLNEALDNAKKRIKLLDNLDKKCVLDEYKEWIKDGLHKHTVLLLREDPII